MPARRRRVVCRDGIGILGRAFPAVLSRNTSATRAATSGIKSGPHTCKGGGQRSLHRGPHKWGDWHSAIIRRRSTPRANARPFRLTVGSVNTPVGQIMGSGCRPGHWHHPGQRGCRRCRRAEKQATAPTAAPDRSDKYHHTAEQGDRLPSSKFHSHGEFS